MDADFIPVLRSDLEINKFDTSLDKNSYLISLDGKNYKISADYMRLLACIDGRNSIAQIRDQLEADGIDINLESLFKIFDEFLLEKGFLKGYEDKHDKKQRSILFIKIPLFTKKVVAPVTGITKVMYNRVPLIITLLFILVAHIFFYLSSRITNPNLLDLSGMEYALCLILITVSSLFHELGHASASRKFGIEHGAIGWGLYFIFSVFYADVSNAWRLNRKQRIVVDLGGIYFQLCYLSLLVVLNLFIKTDSLKYCIYFVDFGILANLNPFLKMDGYWLLSDALGIHNLHKKQFEAYSYLTKRITCLIKRTPPPEKPEIFLLPGALKYIFVVYIIVTSVFLGYFSFMILMYMLPNFVISLPATLWNTLVQLWQAITHFQILEIVNYLFKLFILFMMTLFFANIIWGLIKGIGKFIIKRIKQTGKKDVEQEK